VQSAPLNYTFVNGDVPTLLWRYVLHRGFSYERLC
jgi:hypothetical protein